MRRKAPAIALLVALGSCRGNEPTACDRDAFAKLGQSLASMSIAEQIEHVWPAMVEVCGESIPQPIQSSFAPEPAGHALLRERDPRGVELRNAACPTWQALEQAYASGSLDLSAAVAYEKCNFARYEVLANDEVVGNETAIMAWATHQWLLDQGLDASAAKSVTRALYARVQFESWQITQVPELRWPKAHGVPVGEGIAIHVARDKIDFAGYPELVSLRDGAIVDPYQFDHLYEKLIEHRGSSERLAARSGQPGDEALLIVADAQTPMATILRILALARVAGFPRYGFFVEPEAFEPTYIPVTYSVDGWTGKPDPTRLPTLISIELMPEGLTLGRGWEDRARLEVHALDDLDAVAKYARNAHADAKASRVVVAVADAITLEQTLAVIAAARGADCSETGAGCVLPEVLIAPETTVR
jgi:hypothetical protein